MAVTTTKVSPSGRYAWQIFERRCGAPETVTVICESLDTFPSVHAALLSGQTVLQSIFDGLQD